MKLDLDPDWLRTSMNMWRDAVDMKIPVHDNFKIHFLERRAALLEGFVKTGTSWLTVLRACKAEGQDLVELDVLKADVEAFKKWADDGLKELNTMALQESMKDNIQQMLADPDIGDAVRKLLDPKKLGKDKPPDPA